MIKLNVKYRYLDLDHEVDVQMFKLFLKTKKQSL